MPAPGSGRPAIERILARLKPTQGHLETPCLEYQGHRNNRGYGATMDGSRTNGTVRHVYAHREVYEKLVGPITEGMNVLHHCDNPACCNPEHLYLGDQSRNTLDAVKRGRHYSPFSRTERDRHGLSQGGTAWPTKPEVRRPW